MNGMVIPAPIDHLQPAPLSFSQHDRVGVWEGLPVDCPRGDRSLTVKLRFEAQGYDLVGLAEPCLSLREVPIVPRSFWRIDPAWLALLVRILDNNSHTNLAHLLACLTQNPNPRMIHRNHDIQAFGGT